MKNTKKLIGLATAVLAIASLAACGGTKGSDSKGGAGSSKCTHKYVEVKEESVAATCTTEGKKVTKCEKCGDKKETKVSKVAHKYEDQEGGKAATCTEAGEKVQKCSVCGDVKTSTVEALGHNYVDDADQSGAKKVTCTEDGEKLQHCSRCNAENKEVVPATGHTFGADEWTTPATCEKPGAGTHKCETCGTVEDITADALGHDIQLIGDDSEPEAGYAKVRTYTCARECGTTYLGFKANEPSEASKPHLVIGEDGGARFWGRPIGNDVVLDENGSATADEHTPVYNKEQQGDFFEYIFKLSAAEAAALKNCQLYCDAQAANYLSGKDFWANNAGDEDWTRGMYIDDNPDHYNEDGTGKDIEDYRYVLYVDDKFCEFDPTMKSPVTGAATNNPRKEYVLPYTFSLHEGVNKIRLVMAGGYRSTFYNFTFRAVEAKEDNPGEDPAPVVHEHKWAVQETIAAEGKSSYTVEKCECGKFRNNVNIVDLDGKITKKGGKIGANNQTARYAFNMDAAKDVEVFVKATVDQASNTQYGFYTGKNGGSSPTTLPDGKTNTTFKLNDVVLPAPTDKSYGDLGMTGNTEETAAVISLGAAKLAAGANEFTITRNDSYGLQYYELFFVYEGAVAHNLTAGEKAADSALRPLTCGCAGVKGYELQAADLTEGQKAPVDTNKDTRLGKNIFDDVWNITGIEAGTYALYIQARASAGNASKGYWNSATAVAKGDTAKNNGGDALCNEYKYKVKVDDGEYVNMGSAEGTYADFGLTENSNNWTNAPLATITVAAGAKSVTIHNMNNGYSIWVFAARLVKVA